MALSILAFVGGGLAVNWLSDSGLSPWGGTDSAELTPPAAPAPEPTPPPVNPVLASPGAPQILQPIADSARTEAMLVAMAARRAISVGAPLGDVGTRLDTAFEQSQPQAVARVRAAEKEAMTPTKLAAEFDSVAPQLSREPEMSWSRLRQEILTMFVLHTSDAPPPAADAQLQRARDLVLTGSVESAIRLVETMPGAANAQDWLAKARRYVETQRALDMLEKAALSMPMVAQPSMVAPPATDTAPAIETKPELTAPAI